MMAKRFASGDKTIFEQIEEEKSIFEKRYMISKYIYGNFSWIFRWFVVLAVIIHPAIISYYVQTHWIARSLWAVYTLFFGVLAYIYSFRLIYWLALPHYNKKKEALQLVNEKLAELKDVKEKIQT
jgi:hypothetical protein